MAALSFCHRTLPAYRQSFLVDENTWITTRTPFYYLDLAVPNEILFKMHFEKLFPNNKVETGIIGKFNVSKNQRFHLDDTSVGCKGRKDSNLFYTYAMATDRKRDRIGMRLFIDFFESISDDDAPSLTSGEKAIQFMNLATLIGYHQWRERVIPPSPDRPFSQQLVDYIFSFINPSILKGVYEKKSEHPLLVKELWDLFCITDETQLMLFMEVPDSEHLKFMLEVANRIKFDFWGLKHGGKGLTEHIFIHYIKEKRLDLITLMLEYGFALGEMDPENMEKTCCSCHNPLTHSFFAYTCEEFVHNASMVRFFVRCYEKCRNLIELPGFIVVFQKVSRTLRLPSLPPSVVLKHLQNALGIDPLELPTWPQHMVKDVEEEIEKMAAIYEACDVHPSDSSVVAPQTLSQLSRYAIRDRLAANNQLPTAIGDSHLPTLIKNFLSLYF